MNVKSNESFDDILSYLPPRLQKYFSNLDDTVKASITEIRLRTGQPIFLQKSGECCFITKNGKISYIYSKEYPVPLETEINDIINKACGYSLYSHQDEFINGFLTLPGGHRIGICGTASTEDGTVSAIRHISGINIRIARMVYGSANPILNHIQRDELSNILIVGPPLSGKTTILRDLVRQISNGALGKYYKCAVIDERCEIAMQRNIDIGINTDVLTSFPKAEGIILAVRTLSPDIIFCDEIGTKKDADAILNGINCGVRFVATIHARTLKELKHRQGIRPLIEENAFHTIFFLGDGKNLGKIQAVMQMNEGNSNESDRSNADIYDFCTYRANDDNAYSEAGKRIASNHCNAQSN